MPPAGETARVAPGVLARGDDAEGADGRTDSPTEVADAKMEGASAAEGTRPKDAAVAEPAGAATKPGEAAGEETARATDPGAKPADHGPKLVTPAGSAGLAAAPEGILLRFNSDSRAWERLTAATPLGASTRLLCLYPTRTAVMIGKTQAVMLGECEIRILPQSTDQAPAIELAQGWLVIRPESASKLKMELGDRLVTVEVPQNGVRSDRAIGPVGLRAAGEPGATARHSRCHGRDFGDGWRQARGASAARGAVGRPQRHEALGRGSGSHVGERPLADGGRGQGCAIGSRRFLYPGRPALTQIVDAVEESNADTKQLAIAALKSMGEMSYLIPLLSRKNDLAVRRRALAAIRSYTALGPEASGKVREQLVEEFGEEKASLAGQMIVGFSPQEAANTQLFSTLVGLLSPSEQSVGVRELALETLMRLTGRTDALGYDADQPEKGHSAWLELEREGKLRPAAPAKAKAK